MKLSLKEVLNPEELNQFVTLLKDITPYQLKIHRANGRMDILKKEEKLAFNQLKKDLKPFYDKLDEAWFIQII